MIIAGLGRRGRVTETVNLPPKSRSSTLEGYCPLSKATAAVQPCAWELVFRPLKPPPKTGPRIGRVGSRERARSSLTEAPLTDHGADLDLLRLHRLKRVETRPSPVRS